MAVALPKALPLLAMGSHVTQNSFRLLLERLENLYRVDKTPKTSWSQFGASSLVNATSGLLEDYHSDPSDWLSYALFDKSHYTRNLVKTGPLDETDLKPKFNLMLLCWPPNIKTDIHDHPNSHCFVKCLAGALKEVRLVWRMMWSKTITGPH